MERERDQVAQSDTEDEAAASAQLDGQVDEQVVEELLIEEISIDGMCGVY
jgi:mycofactocin precursor